MRRVVEADGGRDGRGGGAASSPAGAWAMRPKPATVPVTGVLPGSVICARSPCLTATLLRRRRGSPARAACPEVALQHRSARPGGPAELAGDLRDPHRLGQEHRVTEWRARRSTCSAPAALERLERLLGPRREGAAGPRTCRLRLSWRTSAARHRPRAARGRPGPCRTAAAPAGRRPGRARRRSRPCPRPRAASVYDAAGLVDRRRTASRPAAPGRSGSRPGRPSPRAAPSSTGCGVRRRPPGRPRSGRSARRTAATTPQTPTRPATATAVERPRPPRHPGLAAA